MKNVEFQTTHWSVVLRAKGEDSSAQKAIHELCEMYYEPVLHYLERVIGGDSARVYGGRDARDLTHDFFTRLLEGGTFKQLQQRGTRFRAYLLGSVKHFLGKVRDKESTVKRGGQYHQIPLLDNSAELEQRDDRFFDRDWAKTLLERAIALLQTSCETEQLLPWLIREMRAEDRIELARQLDVSDVAIRVSLHRLRKQFRETIRAKIAETVANESEIDAELTYLIGALRDSSGMSDTNV
ncbi:MAG: RNA polymerase sigma factor [Thermoguttaceae bacterium]